MMIISYNMTKRTTKTENENSLKILKLYKIIKLKIIRYKLSASGKIIHLVFNYNLMRPVRILRLPKN